MPNQENTTTTTPTPTQNELLLSMLKGALQSLPTTEVLKLLSPEQRAEIQPAYDVETAKNALEEQDWLCFREYSDVKEYMEFEHSMLVTDDVTEAAEYCNSNGWLAFEDNGDVKQHLESEDYIIFTDTYEVVNYLRDKKDYLVAKGSEAEDFCVQHLLGEGYVLFNNSDGSTLKDAMRNLGDLLSDIE